MQFAVPILFSLTSLAPAPRRFTSPKSKTPEFGFGLTGKEVQAGWISLLDGKSAFGWNGAKVEGCRLSGGSTTTAFGDCELMAGRDH